MKGGRIMAQFLVEGGLLATGGVIGGLIIGGLFDRMAPVLWVIAVIGTLTVIHRMMFTFTAAKQLDDASQPVT